mmetsp:Transcript_27791/g.89810  ORF Transcript_27791/g.89810 Transcript_27791/m.89810 type:complete len:205 (+) Transcript_27791:44-658(+)
MQDRGGRRSRATGPRRAVGRRLQPRRARAWHPGHARVQDPHSRPLPAGVRGGAICARKRAAERVCRPGAHPSRRANRRASARLGARPAECAQPLPAPPATRAPAAEGGRASFGRARAVRLERARDGRVDLVCGAPAGSRLPVHPGPAGHRQDVCGVAGGRRTDPGREARGRARALARSCQQPSCQDARGAVRRRRASPRAQDWG